MVLELNLELIVEALHPDRVQEAFRQGWLDYINIWIKKKFNVGNVRKEKQNVYCHIIRRTHDNGGAFAGGGASILIYEKYKIQNYLKMVGQYCSTVSSIKERRE